MKEVVKGRKGANGAHPSQTCKPLPLSTLPSPRAHRARAVLPTPRTRLEEGPGDVQQLRRVKLVRGHTETGPGRVRPRHFFSSLSPLQAPPLPRGASAKVRESDPPLPAHAAATRRPPGALSTHTGLGCMLAFVLARRIDERGGGRQGAGAGGGAATRASAAAETRAERVGPPTPAPCVSSRSFTSRTGNRHGRGNHRGPGARSVRSMS